LFSIGKLLKILKTYTQEQKLSHFDKNLFLSFYSSKAVEPEEEEGDVKLVPAKPKTPNYS
jgi:hypothetical protein